MFLLVIFLSFTSYAIQGTLMAHYARKTDGLSTVVYRSTSLILTMLPLLFFASWAEIIGIKDYWWQISLAGFSGAIGSALSFYAMKFMPVGIKTVLSRVISSVLAILVGILFFREIISLAQIGVIILILGAGFFLTKQKNDFQHLENNIGKGVIIILLGQIFITTSFSYVAYVSRELSPFVAGYFWEALIGIFSVILVFARQFITGQKVAKISLKEFGKIAAICSLTLVGTGCFMYAITIGDYGIANVMMNGSIFVSILVAYFAFKEKLTSQQWLWILVLVAGVVGLNYV